MNLSPLLIEDAVKAALKEDLGHGFDATSEILIPANERTKGVIKSRSNGVLAGLIVALSAFSLTDIDFDMEIHAQDGEKIKAGDIIATIEGPARSLLTAERVALNFLQHMSGIASLTNQHVEKIKGTGAEICDTRKTLPGLRLFQKYAVAMGGGSNHRFGLDDAILIKDNHIAIAGGIAAALDQAHMLASHMRKIEIEVDTLAQLEEVLENGKADIVMLDNFKVKELEKAVKLINRAIPCEASGGVTLDNVKAIAETGVDYISIGALTHSPCALDIGLDIE
ncbi:MAG: carboxylating nicotinate-nucleotide diphosphorylase [Alphaproteobacteria bacterium]|nr:carboxylating nicotinate-nucleotide diphosphorylase [Alphaproteobacteria bacterium]